MTRLPLRAAWVLALVLAGPAAAEPALRLRWLGTAGFSIEAGDSVLLHDPYLSRRGLLRLLLRRYEPDAEVLSPLLDPDGPVPELARAGLVLIGHSHWDHLGDAAWLARRTGATLVGSGTSVAIARGYGLAPDRGRRAAFGERLREGPFEIRVIESRHAPVLFGRVPLEGRIETPPDGPIHALSFVLGDARSYLIRHVPSGARIYLTSSAAVYGPALDALRAEGVQVDVLLAAIQGREPGYARALVAALRPRRVVPHHYDDFFRPLDDPRAAEPRDPDDLAAFEAEVRAAAETEGVALEVVRLGLFERLEVFGGGR